MAVNVAFELVVLVMTLFVGIMCFFTNGWIVYSSTIYLVNIGLNNIQFSNLYAEDDNDKYLMFKKWCEDVKNIDLLPTGTDTIDDLQRAAADLRADNYDAEANSDTDYCFYTQELITPTVFIGISFCLLGICFIVLTCFFFKEVSSIQKRGILLFFNLGSLISFSVAAVGGYIMMKKFCAEIRSDECHEYGSLHLCIAATGGALTLVIQQIMLLIFCPSPAQSCCQDNVEKLEKQEFSSYYDRKSETPKPSTQYSETKENHDLAMVELTSHKSI